MAYKHPTLVARPKGTSEEHDRTPIADVPTYEDWDLDEPIFCWRCGVELTDFGWGCACVFTSGKRGHRFGSFRG